MSNMFKTGGALASLRRKTLEGKPGSEGSTGIKPPGAPAAADDDGIPGTPNKRKRRAPGLGPARTTLSPR